MQYLRQATTATITLGPFVDSTDGSTPETALTLTVKVAKNGAALAARSDATAIAHDADGNYPVVLNATDTSAIGRLRVAATATGALPVWQDFAVLDEAVYDVLFGTTAPSTHTVAQVWAGAPAGTPLADIGDELKLRIIEALITDTYAEVSGVPAATCSIKDKINWLFKLARNKAITSASNIVIRNDADSADSATATHAESAGTYTRNEWS